jgi:hypothetical protein
VILYFQDLFQDLSKTIYNLSFGALLLKAQMAQPCTLQQLSDLVTYTLESRPELADLTVWTDVEVCAMKAYRVDVVSEGNVSVVITWMNDLEEAGTPFTLRTFSDRLLEILSERPELATDYVWRHLFPSGCVKIGTLSIELGSLFGWEIMVR